MTKTEFMGIGFDPSPISYGSVTINPSSTIKFLGVTIQANLKWDKTVDNLCNRMRFSASKIRTEGRFFDCWERKILFNGWVLGPLYASAISFLPLLNATQRQKLQVAMNSGIRAVSNIPQYGHHNISALRSKLGIPSIAQITDILVLTVAWNRREHFQTQALNMSGPSTKGKGERSPTSPKGIPGTNGRYSGILRVEPSANKYKIREQSTQSKEAHPQTHFTNLVSFPFSVTYYIRFMCKYVSVCILWMAQPN